MYGGKFMPFHKGHKYCLDTAANECSIVYLILFYGGADEEKIIRNNSDKYLSVDDRINKLIKFSKKYNNVELALIDVSNLRKEDGSEDWDAETPLVRDVVGDKLDAVYSSEESYGEYFSRAYPEATHRLVDVKRIHYPISGTLIRNMERKEERNEWMV